MGHMRDMLERVSKPGRPLTACSEAWVDALMSGKWTVEDAIEHVADRSSTSQKFKTVDEDRLLESFRKFHDERVESGQSDRHLFVRFLSSHTEGMTAADRRRVKYLLREKGYKV